ncbi:MAG: hypothetical protein JWP87_3594 [Labilithrix sp.]|nr:hypothetical protein [Labilithrix sp.]
MRFRGARVGHVGLASTILVVLAVAACGEGAGQAPGPQVPGTTAPSATVAPPATGATGAPAASGSVSVPPAGTAPAAPVGPMKPIAASAFAEDLKKLGIDPLKPQPLNKLSPDTIRKLMPTFAKSLGVKCDACHDTNNFKTWTPKKRVASKMWQEFVVGMQMDDGTPLYCDSCHGGKQDFLDRTDKKALSGWMDTNYVKKLRRSDKKEHSCEQCHGDPFEPKFLAQWAASK